MYYVIDTLFLISKSHSLILSRAADMRELLEVLAERGLEVPSAKTLF